MSTPNVVKIDKGNAKLCVASGNGISTIRTIDGSYYGGFSSGQIIGNEVHITTNKGQLRIYDIGGSIKRIKV
ncbi:hypothetical protein A9308_07465 [Moraxella atlantae]|uniref:Uncharacterized protein n=1 Tax=Faucicola atlantae TaxID=34059 RepID=A0A1B8QBC6_9GAMM|nr:hypothetical protein [Moraxella atlantae]OBX76764.1 hypothetical protein A9308_07465 [Moraxella atlantae]